ncbi:MAG TPA: hypothetical protein VF985_05035 [Mariniflexile sp.]
MKQTVQNKITNLKAIAKSSASISIAKSSSRMVNDNLSKSIRSERDAKIFRKELTVAFKLAKE